MRSLTMLAAAAVLLFAACGEDEETAAPAERAAKLAPASAIEADPYAITCGHVRDQLKWADATRRATVAIADRERFKGLNRLRASQSVYYALTEVCKQQPATHEPARAAAEGVHDGTYRVQTPDHSREDGS